MKVNSNPEVKSLYPIPTEKNLELYGFDPEEIKLKINQIDSEISKLRESLEKKLSSDPESTELQSINQAVNKLEIRREETNTIFFKGGQAKIFWSSKFCWRKIFWSCQNQES